MNQNILIPALTVLVYIASILGGNATSLPPTESHLTTPDIQGTIVAGQHGQVIGQSVMLRSGPSAEHSVVTVLQKDTSVVLLTLQDGWYHVRTQEGQTGWIADYLIAQVPGTIVKHMNHDKTVLGYYLLQTQSYDSLVTNSDSLTSIAPWSWGLNSYGELTADFDPAKLAEVLLFAGNQQIETYALIHNMQNGTFDSRVVSALLNNEIASNRAIDQIHQVLLEWGMTGVNIDLENVPASDRQALSNFIANLSDKLHTDGLKVTMAVPAKTADNATNSFSGAYDYRELGRHVDQLVIMAYDQHYRGGPPGPIASAKWVEEVVKFAVNEISSTKIILGIPNYGYNWPPAGLATGMTYNQIMDLAAKEGATIRWDNDARVPFFKYGNGHELWFENRYSIKYKLDLVNEYDLNGIALWRLGQEDQGIWETIDQTFSK